MVSNSFVESVKFSMKEILIFIVMALPAFSIGQGKNITWQVFPLGSSPMTICLPGKPRPMEAELSQSLLQILHSYYAYRYDDIRTGVVVMLFHISYTEGINADMDRSAGQTISELISCGAMNIKYTSDSILIDRMRGLSLKGTFESNGITQEFTTTVLAEGSKVWMVISYAKAGKRRGQKTLKSILNSITFKEK